MNLTDLHHITKLYRDHISPDLARLLKFGGPGSLEVAGEGCYIIDHLGRRYLDLAGGYGVFNLGYCHPKVVGAVTEQLGRLPLSSKILLNPQTASLAQQLSEIAPGQLAYSFFCNSGTEAVEAALKVARLHTKRIKFVSCLNSYHGKTLGSLSVTGRAKYQDPFRPLIEPVSFVPFNDVSALENAIDEHTAAFLVEPVQGEGGIYVATPEFLTKARQICDRHGALLIADEIQSGLGRTGEWFAVQHAQVVPDLMVLAKALGGGVLPIGALMGTKEVWQVFKGQPLIHTSTFGGNPLACAAAKATIDVLRQENLVQAAQTKGSFFKKSLVDLSNRFPEYVSQVRGLGLMIGMEFRQEEYAGKFISELVKSNILAVYTLNQPRVIRFEPALIIEESQLQHALEKIEQALSQLRPLAVTP